MAAAPQRGANPSFATEGRLAVGLLLRSREACVDYMMPLGLHHIFKFDHHYGPEPDGFKAHYPLEWCPVYYHQADTLAVGFDRTQATGSGATAQYREPYRSQYENLSTCPERYLLWFHHVPWTYRTLSGRTLWEEMQYALAGGRRKAAKAAAQRPRVATGLRRLFPPVCRAEIDNRYRNKHKLLRPEK